jgi:capsular polysaccharide transport system ATP-binding protein
MSVRLKDIRVPAAHNGAVKPLFDGVNFYVEAGARVGILGPAKSGKTTLLRLICGTAYPEAGRITRNARISWPIPLSGFCLGDTSVAQNIRFVGSLYGVEDDQFAQRIGEMVEISEFLNVPLKESPKFVKPRLALALGISIDFDIYLFDGSFASVDKEFKEKAGALVAGRMDGRGYVLAAATPAEVGQNCDSVYVLDAGQARYFASAEEGVNHFKALAAADKKKQQSGDETSKRTDEDEDEDGVLGDVNVLGAAIADELD